MASLSEGRLFHFEILSISAAANDDDTKSWDETPIREAIQFWLCGACSLSMTLKMLAIGGLHLLPLEDEHLSTTAGPDPSKQLVEAMQ
jgi:hypothetical protein